MRNAANGRWPFRPQAYEDELLSSWITRIALGHGLKLATFLSIVGIEISPLTLDLNPGEDILTLLAEKTGADTAALSKLTLPFLQNSENLLYRNASGPAMQYCPACLTESAYFRRSWRVAYIRVCVRHCAVLVDACGHCGANVRFEELDPTSGQLSVCRNCLIDLASQQARMIDQKLAMRFAELQARLLLFTAHGAAARF